jgi:hypothetical protein
MQLVISLTSLKDSSCIATTAVSVDGPGVPTCLHPHQALLPSLVGGDQLASQLAYGGSELLLLLLVLPADLPRVPLFILLECCSCLLHLLC